MAKHGKHKEKAPKASKNKEKSQNQEMHFCVYNEDRKCKESFECDSCRYFLKHVEQN